jgi:hypothetical protein
MFIDTQILYSGRPRVLDGVAVKWGSHLGVVREKDRRPCGICRLVVDRSLALVSLAILLQVLVLGRASAQHSPNERLKSVTTIFVEGSSPLSKTAREKIESGRTCFTLAPELSSADAVLEIVVDYMSSDTGTNTVSATASLTLKSGERAWSRAERVVMSGGFAIDLINRLINRLAADASCKTRAKK